MAFFETTKLDEQAAGWARGLYEALRKHRKAKPSTTFLKSWAATFVKLRAERGAEVVGEVLEWYCDHLTDQYTPHAHSADSFRGKFEQIVAAMDRDVELAADKIDLRSQAQAKSFLASYHLPAELAAALPSVIQRSRDNWKSFCKRMETWRAANLTVRGAGFIGWVLEMNRQTFLPNWLRHLSDRYGKLESLPGAVSHAVFTPSCDTFKQTFWRRWAMSWSIAPKSFDSLLEELLK